jgi:hypothetical protein
MVQVRITTTRFVEYRRVEHFSRFEGISKGTDSSAH